MATPTEWVLEDARRLVREHISPRQNPLRKIQAWAPEHPIRTAVYANALILIAAFIAYGLQPSFLPQLAPRDPGELLQSAWQVHAGFSAIAFAGLVMLVDVGGRETKLSPANERQFLLRYTNFDSALAFALTGAISVAITATWFPAEETLVAAVCFVVVPSTVLVTRGYLRAVRMLTHPRYSELIERDTTVRSLEQAIVASSARRIANARLGQVVDRAWNTNSAVEKLVVMEHDSRLVDVDVTLLAQIVLILKLPAATTNPTPAKPPSSRKIEITAPISGGIRAGAPLFTCAGPLIATERVGLDRALRSAVRLERQG